jgi:two-component system cell cycle sensor histidine kinase/response regulator CckA
MNNPRVFGSGLSAPVLLAGLSRVAVRGSAARAGLVFFLVSGSASLRAAGEDGRGDEGVFISQVPVWQWGAAGLIGGLVVLGAMAVRMRALRRELVERRGAEETVVRLNQRLSVATRAAGIGIWDWDVAQDLLVWDEEMYRLYHVRQDDFSGAHEAWVKILHPEDKARVQTELRASLRGGKPFEAEFRIVWPDGTVRVIQSAAQTFLSADGKPLRMVGVNYDITGRLKAEQAQLKSEEKFSKAFRASPVIMGLTSLTTGRFTEVNESIERVLGYSREEVIGRTTVELGIWADPLERDRMVKTVMACGSVRDEEVRLRTKQGRELVVQYSAELIVLDGERHLLSVLMDITARKRAEAERAGLVHDLGERIKELTALNQTSRLLQADRPFNRELLEELVMVVPPAWQYPAICAARITYGEMVAVSTGWRESPWRQVAKFATDVGSAGSIEVVYTEERPPKAEGPFLAEERHLIESLAEMLVAHIGRRSAVEALGRSEARFRSAMVHSAVGMAIVAPNGRWLEVNPALCRIVGYTREELLVTSFKTITHPDDLEADLAQLARLLSGEIEIYEREKRYFHKDGHIVWIHLNVSVVRDGEGRPVNFISQTLDITARKQAEEALAAVVERLALALRVSKLGVWRHNLQTRVTEWDERMFGIFGLTPVEHAPGHEQILARVVDEDRAQVWRSWNALPSCEQSYHMRFRITHTDGEPRQIDLQGVVHNDSLGRPEWAIGVAADITDIVLSAAESERLRAQLQQARRGAMSARDLVRRILNFSRAKNGQTRARVDIVEIVRDTAPLLTAALPGRISISLDIAVEAAQVLADAGQIQQVLMNFCTNGAHAIGSKAGTLRIHVRMCDLEPDTGSNPAAGRSGGRHVCLAVTDSGAGMDETTRKRIFEPFFTTKKPGEGTGLGLSIVRDIVTAHGGRIDVISKQGGGTTFSIYLPVAPGGAGAPVAPDVEMTDGGDGQRILIVDDEPSVAMVLRLALQKGGYRSEMYTSPSAAWKRFSDAPGNFDLLMIDQNMPEINGYEFMERARKAAPMIPIILLSGRFERAQTPAILQQARVSALQKPFEIADLLGVVRSSLKK